MLKRYQTFSDTGVRDIEGYNKYVKKHEDMQPMPKIVICIDELSDLMMAAPKEIEDSICRLAQMARAAGMHLVIATQRPSVDVITGLIKANISSRIALTVSSQIDSRTILDAGLQHDLYRFLKAGIQLFRTLVALKGTFFILHGLGLNLFLNFVAVLTLALALYKIAQRLHFFIADIAALHTNQTDAE